MTDLPEVIDFQGSRWVRMDVVQEREQRLAAALARVALSETGDKCWSDFAQDFLGWKSTSELWDIIKAAKGGRDDHHRT